MTHATISSSSRERPAILNIGDSAGVASVYSTYLNLDYGLTSSVANFFHLDPAGISEFYGAKLYRSSRINAARLLLRARKYGVVIIHTHHLQIRRLRAIYPRKKMVAFFHGEDARLGGWPRLAGVVTDADAVFCSNDDLLDGAPSEAVYLPNPVDTRLFRIRTRRSGAGAVHFITHHEGERIGWANEMARKVGVNLKSIDRAERPVRYAEMPELLSGYECYIDRAYPPSLSLTALQALSVGLRVVDWNGDVRDRLPPEHLPENATRKLHEELVAKGILEGVA